MLREAVSQTRSADAMECLATGPKLGELEAEELNELERFCVCVRTENDVKWKATGNNSSSFKR